MQMPNRIYLLRVGADSNYGGFHSPIYDERFYKFIPIPDNKVLESHRVTYQDYLWCGEPIIGYMPDLIHVKGTKVKGKKEENFLPWFVHDDPEFRTCTYGSPLFNSKLNIEKNYRLLSGLKKDDFLVFYAAFSAHDRKSSNTLDGYYLFAYFVIETESVKFKAPDALPAKLQERIRENHHFLHNRYDQIVVLGDKKRSRVFKKAVLLSLKSSDLVESNYYPCGFMRKLLKYEKALNLSSLRTLDKSVNLEAVKNYLDATSEGNIIGDT